MFEESVSLRMWKRFVHEGVIDSARINKRISESWHRCKRNSVNPYAGTGQVVLAGDALASKQENSRLLLELALPQINRLSPFIHDLGMIALVIDPEGYVLSMQGEKHALADAHAINFVEGVRWTEDEVGTNAIGTAIQAKEAIMINGTEHYSVASHRWSCFAAPIHDEKGALLGVIDVSSRLERSHPQTMATVMTLAYSIEQAWIKQRQQDELELIHRSLLMADEKDSFTVVCNREQRLVYASKRVRTQIVNWAGLARQEVTEKGFLEARQTPVFSIRHQGVIGWAIELVPSSLQFPRAYANGTSTFRYKGEAGMSKTFDSVLLELSRIAPTDANAVIFGESGTGKELAAQAIHDNSPRKDGPFVAVNCGAIPRELMESELFGYVEGAFTGARRRGYQGKLAQANGGTLFLDEIGEIPLAMQVALLRVLQERKVTPIGSSEEQALDIRVIAATHRNLLQQVREGTFREDLYYRLHVLPVSLPPLRSRKEDIPLLIRHYCQKNGYQLSLSADTLSDLMAYDWPGNIRELYNVVERMRVLPQEDWKRFLKGLPAYSWQNARSTDSAVSVGDSSSIAEASHTHRDDLSFRDQLERKTIVQALEKSGGSASVAAELLGIPRSTFYRKLKKYRL
ncbi:sigma-54-dependent Fis family transcriptional regulator [Brevibacillus reuszeri]|uniref:sigma-54-dependent Fis family transcriptional regulator n=1 Tax=Brevibacillus reuszeri TaxID=54915 RepID=UPI001B0F9393|nr:sigma-54-dependent Fis family transcriptional regulator [Brevibacillus reuszeri]GIO08575.1 sigma-54-dependent Fis family transcriptional regulator [Brevibacillus reuszeri]